LPNVKNDLLAVPVVVEIGLGVYGAKRRVDFPDVDVDDTGLPTLKLGARAVVEDF
jgi:hypothetical protein